MTAAVEFNLSDLVRKPTEVVAEAERREVIIHRRGKDDLTLQLASRAHRGGRPDDLIRLMALAAGDEAGLAVIGKFMPDLYPWMRFLPDDALGECVTELLTTAVACASVRNFSRYEVEVAAWRSTAEIYADPELYARLHGEIELDFSVGSVPCPEVTDAEAG
jgi:hypothetical protein